jgi:hypothetical protein
VLEELHRFIEVEEKSLMVLLSRCVEMLKQGDFVNPRAKKLMVNSLRQKANNFYEALEEVLSLLEDEEIWGVYQESVIDKT